MQKQAVLGKDGKRAKHEIMFMYCLTVKAVERKKVIAKVLSGWGW